MCSGQRTREIGIRIALGSRPLQIGWLVAARAARHLGIGLAVGLAGALAINQLLRGVLIGIGSTDYATLGGVALVLVASLALHRRFPSIGPCGSTR
jgi:hypothetical protein